MNADGTQKMEGGGVWAVVHANSEGHGASRERAKRGGDANGGREAGEATHRRMVASFGVRIHVRAVAWSGMDEEGSEGGAQQWRSEGSEGRE